MILWHKLSSKILPSLHEFMLSTTVLLRAVLPKMWLTGSICRPAKPFATENWSRNLRLKFFLMIVIALIKKLFLSNLLTPLFYINFNHKIQQIFVNFLLNNDAMITLESSKFAFYRPLH